MLKFALALLTATSTAKSLNQADSSISSSIDNIMMLEAIMKANIGEASKKCLLNSKLNLSQKKHCLVDDTTPFLVNFLFDLADKDRNLELSVSEIDAYLITLASIGDVD